MRRCSQTILSYLVLCTKTWTLRLLVLWLQPDHDASLPIAYQLQKKRSFITCSNWALSVYPCSSNWSSPLHIEAPFLTDTRYPIYRIFQLPCMGHVCSQRLTWFERIIKSRSSLVTYTRQPLQHHSDYSSLSACHLACEMRRKHSNDLLMMSPAGYHSSTLILMICWLQVLQPSNNMKFTSGTFLTAWLNMVALSTQISISLECHCLPSSASW